jgi:peptidoglycan/xylan/chitin deacetylase (PgdA/CDA1 family)
MLRTIKRIYKFIPVEDIESYFYDKREQNNCCHICFDDGDRTFYENALPVLKEMNIPATLFVSPKVINSETNYWFQELNHLRNLIDNVLIKETICEISGCDYLRIKNYDLPSIVKCMKLKDILQVINAVKERCNITKTERCNITKKELYELSDSSIITIGAHTINHPILSNETDDNAEKEIRESVEELSTLLGRDIKYFAYPNGKAGLDWGIREQLILQENKIRLAFTTDAGFFNPKTNPLGIPRSGCSKLTGLASHLYWVKLLLLPIWDNISRRTETRERKEIKELSIL